MPEDGHYTEMPVHGIDRTLFPFLPIYTICIYKAGDSMLSIAVCDDEIIECCNMAKRIKGIMEEMKTPCIIRQFQSGRELLEALESFDIVFLDIIMQDLDGMKTAQVFRKQAFDKILIFMSSSREYVFEAYDVEAFQYLLKPVDDRKLKSVLQKAVPNIIHKNMSIEAQAEEVDKVKRSENGVITDPFSLTPEHTLKDADALMAKFRISGVPITEGRKLVGIITNRDLKFETDFTKKIKESMTSEGLITAREGITLEEAKMILAKARKEKLPIVDENYNLTGLITIKDIEKTIKYPLSAKDEQGRLLCGAGVGITANVLDRVGALADAKVDVVVLDSAHGHSENVLHCLRMIKEKYPDIQVIAGNVATGEGTRDLIEAGADAVKVGIGPGSICTTRVVAGIGVPQITAIMDAYAVAKEYGIPIIADGGIKYSGDMTKAIAAGGNVCMMGSMFAGCDESPGTFELYQGRKYKVYRGMGSIAAMENGSKDRYFQSDAKKLVPEGVEGRVAYKGTVEDTIFQLMGGLRSGMGYCGTQSIEELKQNGRFMKISAASLKESHPHDIHITKEAPNYSVDE